MDGALGEILVTKATFTPFAGRSKVFRKRLYLLAFGSAMASLCSLSGPVELGVGEKMYRLVQGKEIGFLRCQL